MKARVTAINLITGRPARHRARSGPHEGRGPSDVDAPRIHVRSSAWRLVDSPSLSDCAARQHTSGSGRTSSACCSRVSTQRWRSSLRAGARCVARLLRCSREQCACLCASRAQASCQCERPEQQSEAPRRRDAYTCARRAARPTEGFESQPRASAFPCSAVMMRAPAAISG